MPDRNSHFCPHSAASHGSADVPSFGPHPVRLGALARVPNGIPTQAVYRALVQPHAWEPHPEDAAYLYTETRGEGVSVTWHPAWHPEERFGAGWWYLRKDEVLSAVQQQFFRIKSDLASDLIDIAFLHWLENQRPAKVQLSLSQLCAYRQIQPTSRALAEHSAAMSDIRGFRIHTPHIDAQLLDLDIAQGTLWQRDTCPPADLRFIYSPGAFVGAAVAGSAWCFASYSPQLLHLDPYHDQTAKRLGRYLRSEWRTNPELYGVRTSAPSGGLRFRTWVGHLSDAGIVPADRDHKHPGEFIARIYAALGRLGDHDCLAVPPAGMSVEAWVEELLTHPDDRAPLPARGGRLAAFLARRVCLPPPPSILAALERDASLRQGRRSADLRLASPKP